MDTIEFSKMNDVITLSGIEEGTMDEEDFDDMFGKW